MRRWDPATPFRALRALPEAVSAVTRGARETGVPRPADAIVLLGAAVRPDGSPSPSLRARIDGAEACWRAGLAPVIVCTGAHHLHPPGEAVVAARELRSRGIPEAALLLDEKSRNTLGNLVQARGLLPERSREVFLVTEPFHMGRAMLLAEQVGFSPIPWPVTGPAWERPTSRAKWVARDILSLALHLGTR
jgi:uncharacterized SAM-binding protein YcdF (DUF218 family)